MPIFVVREIRGLRAMRHPNVVRLHDVITSKPGERNRQRGEVFMVFEYCEHDLAGLITTPEFALTPAVVRSYMHQLLSGLAAMHAGGWVHRDIKTANVLVSAGNEVKIADLGLARNLNVGRRQFSTFQVVTPWYRAPEIVFGDPACGTAVDVWSAGCILAELLTRQPLFTGDDNVQLIRQIYRLCGVPDPSTWPGLKALKGWHTFKPRTQHAAHLKTKFKRCVRVFVRGMRGRTVFVGRTLVRAD
jgi:serine/threonine protein kinase